MENVAVQYFLDIFSTSPPTELDVSLYFVSQKVCRADNRLLLEEPTDHEIRRTLFDINLDKAPGPDDMNSKLFQKF